VEFAQKLLSTRGGTVAVSGAAAVLAAVVLLLYLNRYRESVRDSTKPVSILVATDLIEKGTSGNVIGTQELFQVSSTPKSEVKEGAVTDPSVLRGRVAVDDIYPGQQLTAADFSAGSADAFANRITADQRAMSVPLDAAHGMIGDVRTGDHVDVFGAFNVKRLKADGTVDSNAAERPVVKLIVEDVLVLKAADNSKGGFGGGAQGSTVALRVNDEQAAQIAFSSENGRIWIVLRPKTGADPTTPDIVTLETLLFGVKPVAALRSFGGGR
jgi:Flp pilus assembly protein CpaB